LTAGAEAARIALDGPVAQERAEMKPVAQPRHPSQASVSPTRAADPATPTPHSANTFSVTAPCRYATDTWVQGSQYAAAAYLVVSKVSGGLWYTVTGSAFNDTAYYGQHLSLTFSAASAVPRPAAGPGASGPRDGLRDRIEDRGDSLWVCLSSISGPLANLAEAVPYFDARFGGMAIEAVASVRKAPG
jgi:hypothetical protein